MLCNRFLSGLLFPKYPFKGQLTKLSKFPPEPSNSDSLYRDLVVQHSKILQSSVERSISVHLQMFFYFQWIPCSYLIFLFLLGKGNTVNYDSSIFSHFSVLENLLSSASDLLLKQMMSSFLGANFKTAASFSYNTQAQYVTIISMWLQLQNYNPCVVLSTCVLEGNFFFFVDSHCTLDLGRWKNIQK